MKQRVAKLGLVLAGLYFAFSTVVYVGSLCLGVRDHGWWPIFLYPVIFPCSWLFEVLLNALSDWLTVNGAAQSSWLTMDRIAGALYIVGGSLWLWLVGHWISAGATRLFPIKDDEPHNI